MSFSERMPRLKLPSNTTYKIEATKPETGGFRATLTPTPDYSHMRKDHSVNKALDLPRKKFLGLKLPSLKLPSKRFTTNPVEQAFHAQKSSYKANQEEKGLKVIVPLDYSTPALPMFRETPTVIQDALRRLPSNFSLPDKNFATKDINNTKPKKLSPYRRINLQAA